MALTATIYHFEIALSDVDRGVYETLDLRVAQHPSESMRYMLTRTLAYCLAYEEGIAFSKGGLSNADEAPITVRDPTGILLAWIDIGQPSAERLHKAAKAARRVVLYTATDLALVRKEASARVVHRAEEIEVFRFDKAFLDAIEEKVQRKTKLEITRNEGVLYVTIGGAVIEGTVERSPLIEA